MRLVFLNTWNGRHENFNSYIEQLTAKTDIFCFQEAYKEELRRQSTIPNFQLQSVHKRNQLNELYSLASFVREGISLIDWAPVISEQMMAGLGLFTKLNYQGIIINICNFHGTPQPGDKKDTKARLDQSLGLIKFLQTLPGPKILGGDFNLDPDTRSLRLIEEAGFRNLIRDYGIKTTRNSIAWKPYPDNPQFFADYVFVSPEIKIKDFVVPQDLVSDHQPMFLEIED